MLPAYAGVIRRFTMRRLAAIRAPRVRGGDPLDREALVAQALCSPRTRGGSEVQAHPVALRAVLPAYAGVILLPTMPPCGRRRAPRVRGGDPRVISIETADNACSPRTRG